MKKTIILCLILYVCFTLSPGIHKEKHKSTNQCCTSKGGKLCGTIVKDCCKTGCEPGLLNSQWCKDNQQLNPICETCLSTCKKQGGIPCQISANTGRVSCCSLQNCIKAQNSTDDSGIGEKLIGYATSKLIGIALNQHQLADEIIEKFKGPNNYCKEGTEINIGNCMADSFVDLVQAKIMS